MSWIPLVLVLLLAIFMIRSGRPVIQAAGIAALVSAAIALPLLFIIGRGGF